jgi:hypothetical protein
MSISTVLERASTTIVLDAAADFANGETIVIGGKTYTAESSLTNVDGNVKIGATIALTMVNLINAINLNAGTAGTDYAALMTKNKNVFAVQDSATQFTVYSKVPGEIGNFITVANGTGDATIGNATLENGVGDVGVFFDGIFSLNQVNSELVDALRQFSPVEGGFLDGVTGAP